jgi:hypothetical protein
MIDRPAGGYFCASLNIIFPRRFAGGDLTAGNDMAAISGYADCRNDIVRRPYLGPIVAYGSRSNAGNGLTGNK